MGLLGLENSEQELLMSPVSGQKLQRPNSKRKNNEVEVLPLIPPAPLSWISSTTISLPSNDYFMWDCCGIYVCAQADMA